MMQRCLAIGLLFGLAITVGACGGGGESAITLEIEQPDLGPEPEPEMPDEVSVYPDSEPAIPLPLPELKPRMAAHAPVHNIRRPLGPDMIYIGADVKPSDNVLNPIGKQDGITVTYGTIRDGVSASKLIEHLSYDRVIDGIHVVRPIDRWRWPPTVRVADNATSEMLSDTVRVVQILNAALPKDWQLSVDPRPISSDIPRSDGEIIVNFQKPPSHANEGGGEANWWNTHWNNQPGEGDMIAGHVYVSPVFWTDPSSIGVSKDRGLYVIAHEIFHTLGRHHPDPLRKAQSITNGSVGAIRNFLLHPLDRDTLLAVHDVLEAGDTPDTIAEKLGAWEDTSIHIRGDMMEEVSFGVAMRNELAQPWASGTAPWALPADNPAFSEMLIWEGQLFGFTPIAETVTGKARLEVKPLEYIHSLEFTDLESWAANGPPGSMGTGTKWWDGDLRYDVIILGNTLKNYEGESLSTGTSEISITLAEEYPGTITGAFFGPQHEAMGGVLERDDLTAAFGGKR